MRTAGRVDDNSAEIVRALRGCGAFVEPRLSKLGKGVPDLLVVWHGRVSLIEIKNAARPRSARALTRDEAAWHRRLRAAGYTVPIVETIEQALRAIGALIAAAKAEELRLIKVGEATELRKQVKSSQASALEHAQVAAAGVERRAVTCEERPHPTAPRMQLHRLDLPEIDPDRIIEERQMTAAEERGAFEPGAGDEPSSTEAASDSAAANGTNGAARKRGRPAKAPEPCPGTIAEPERDDPTRDTLCSEACIPRKWACERHVALPQSEKVRLVARRQRRTFLLGEQEKLTPAQPQA